MPKSWLESANQPGCDFPLENLPWCRFNGGRIGVAIGDRVLEVERRYDRERLTALLRHDAVERPPERALHRMKDVRFDLPFEIGDYTDFYASIHHATRVGKLLRPDNPLPPNYKHVPIAYHGRASSIVVSGTAVRRPSGQLREAVFGATENLDYEMELGMFIKEGNEPGEQIKTSGSSEHIAGFCLLNDWSARDIQRWEYQPLGPFLGKSFATTISPWVVTPEALAPYQIDVEDRPATLEYLRPAGHAYDIVMEVWVNGELTGRSNARHLYWTAAQMIAHHTSNGCNLREGDLLASGTVSGPEDDQCGCLLETGKPYLQDGDDVIMRAYAESPGKPRIGFGECRGRIEPAR